LNLNYFVSGKFIWNKYFGMMILTLYRADESDSFVTTWMNLGKAYLSRQHSK